MDFLKLIEQRNRKNPFSQYVGLTVTQICEGYAEAILPVRGEHLNPLGFVHGGCLYTLADVVCGSAAISYGKQSVTLSGSLNYLSPGKSGSELRAAAKVCRHGRTISVFDVEISSDEGTALAKGSFTFYHLDQVIEL